MKIPHFHITPLPWGTYFAHLRHYGLAIVIFVLGALISLTAFHLYRNQDLRRMQAEFDRLADIRLFLIEEKIKQTVEQVDMIQKLYETTQNISNSEFHIFIQYSFDLYPNLLAIGWLDLETLHQKTQQSLLGFSFIDLTNQQNKANQHFFPLTYLEWNSRVGPLYFDSRTYPIFLELLKQTKDLSDKHVSNNVSYWQHAEKQGFFLFNSVFHYSNFSKHTDGNLKGIVVGFSNFEDIFESVRTHIEPIGINMGLYDISGKETHLLYWNPAITLQDPPHISSQDQAIQEQWSQSHNIYLGNRIWQIKATPTLGFIHQHRPWQHIEVPIIGILISGLTSFYFLVLVNRRVLIEKEVQERTSELGTINRILQQEVYDRQTIEENLSKKQNYLQRSHEALEYLTKFSTTELREAMRKVISRTASVMQVDRVSVWFYEDLGQIEIFSCEGIYTLSTHSFSDHVKGSSQEFPCYFKRIKTHSQLIIPDPTDAELNQELHSYLTTFHIISKLDIPIVFEGNLLGVLCCEETHNQREWQLEDLHFGKTIAEIIAIMIEQAARQKAEKALQESEERLRFITQKAIDGILSVTDKGEITSWNYGAEQMFGYTEFEMLGKPLHTVILQDNLHKGEIAAKPIELKGKHREGYIFPVEVSHTRWKSGELYFDTIIVRDITERKENEKRLIRAMREAKAANEAKSEFLATISHELRTPLNAIIGFNQCLLMEMDGAINAQQQESLKKIEKSAFHLLNLINDVLDLAKIEANKVDLETSPQNIVELTHSCLEEIQLLIKQKNLTLIQNIPSSPILIEMDPIRMRQVLLNLLSNAVKFTETGSITVTVLNDVHHVEIHVQDTGIGLTAEEMSKIFHPFTQADSSITRKYGGTGLGLVISKKIIDLHGGTITIQSEKGQGSTFIVSLPKSLF